MVDSHVLSLLLRVHVQSSTNGNDVISNEYN